MSSITPSRSNDYAVGADTRLGAGVWNPTFGDIAQRLAELETLRTSVEATIQSVAAGNLDTALQAVLGPQLTALKTEYAALLDEVAQAKDQLVAIQSGIVLGSSVQVTAGGMFPDPLSLQAAIVSLSAAIDDDPDFVVRVAAAEAATVAASRLAHRRGFFYARLMRG